MTKQERRYIATELEVRSSGSTNTVSGYAAIFNSYSQDLGGFVEQVQPRAFAKTLQESDVRAYWNHNRNQILGRVKAETLRLAEDSRGLHYEVDLPNTSYATDLRESIARGDVTQSSFGFETVNDGWTFTERSYPLRTLKEVKLYDVSPVSEPAYEDTDGLSLRAYETLAFRLDRNLSEVMEAAQANELGALLTHEQQEALQTNEAQEAADETETQEPVESTSDVDVLAKLHIASLKMALNGKKYAPF